MFSLMLQKILHKKWIILCMLAGNILLIAVAVSFPMYRASSFQRMLTEQFDDYWIEKGKWPAGFCVEYSSLKGTASEGMGALQSAVEQVAEQTGIPVKESDIWLQADKLKGRASVIRDSKSEKSMKLAAMSDFFEHVELLYGRMPSGEITEDGCIEVIASESAMVNLDLLMDDEYEFTMLSNGDGSYTRIRVVGVFQVKDASEIYWLASGSELKEQVFSEFELFKQSFTTDGAETARGSISYRWNIYWDYERIPTSGLSAILKNYESAASVRILKDRVEADTFKSLVTEYIGKARRVEAAYTILQMPVLLLLCAFLYMISGQMLQLEQNEISLMKSRGASKGQILLLYFLQSSFLTLFSFLIALPLGVGFCRFLGSATGFLEFGGRESLKVRIWSGDVFLYGGIAMLGAIAMTTLPVIGYSGITIVKLKQGRNRKKKSWWKKTGMDILCLGIGLYGYFSYKKGEQELAASVLEGKMLDPLLYISFALFVLGCGLLFCRLQPLFIKLIFKLGKKWLHPAAYASMLQTIRTGYKQEFIILFMILTVAIGIASTTISRTILANMTQNTTHETGAKVVFQEIWMRVGEPPTPVEPPYGKYQEISGVEQMTKVFRHAVTVTNLTNNAEKASGELMAIEAQGFAEVTQMKEGLLPYPYYDYLNVLAGDREGFLVSQNFMEDFGYSLGDSLMLKDAYDREVKGKIRGFFAYWPGYVPGEYGLSEDTKLKQKENYLVVGNLPMVQEAMTVLPYEIWMDVNDEGRGLYNWLEENPKTKVGKLWNINQILQDKKEDTLLQSTNGILSMSFVIILLLCCVGYLLYWIMSIRSRELLFGVLRAMGMRKGEITWMLVIEQIFSGLLAILAGCGIGMFTSRMYVPMIQKALADSDQILPLELITNLGDIAKLLAVIGVMLCICLFVLGRIISHLKISNALKLGED